ncbi:hypothetical protein OAR00_01965 [Alphaproteobacteria bacterium]|nr:hypothetical protein [Alphaproteobacteria bacterium]MDC1023302.1 hypothetical protein [Alphaproteobacteria bacterium]
MPYTKLILIFIMLFNVSCFETVQKNGISNAKIKEIKIEPGKTSRTNLIEKYGPPVFKSVFNKNTIYYISHVSSFKNLSDHNTTSLVVLEITLDKKNIVQKVKKYTEDDAENIKVSKKKSQDNNDKSIMFFKDIIRGMTRRNLDN